MVSQWTRGRDSVPGDRPFGGDYSCLVEELEKQLAVQRVATAAREAGGN